MSQKKAEEHKPQIVIKKVHGKHGGHHGGAWKVAYADFVTAMMALFIVLWIIASADPTLKAGLAQYFRDPGVFETTAGSLFPEGKGVHPAATPLVGEPASPFSLEQLQGQLRAEFHGLAEYLTIQDQIQLHLTPEGLLIDLMDKDQQAFFAVGSAQLTPLLLRVLEMIAQKVQPLPHKIAISGHTDARPYRDSAFYSNWELSTARALNARRALEGMGIPSTRIARVSGHADSSLLFPDNPFNPANRRISILILRDP
ncbi:MAG: OmpA family protein [Candidatus Binatia bacterium]|nr:OmpA family protein [Candidatus Binatia bacterium]